MADIIQRIGFEVGNSIATLDSLSQATRRFNTALRALNKTAASGGALAKTGAAFDRVNASAKGAAAGATRASAAMQTAGTRGAAAGKSLTISWETFARVIATQLIVRGLNAITQALGEAATAAAAFEIDTARIANITAEGQAGVDGLRDSINGLAEATGRPIAEVTEASLEALQNNLGNTAETIDLLTGAADDLAKITGSTLTSSINSLSSVLKAFNRPISDAADIADTFFVAIDKGRISLDQMENRLGTILPQSNALGISFEEAAAAAASLTLSGLNTQTALTQIRNIQAKLIKPTEELEKAFKNLGVTSGEELVERFGGLSGALRALQRNFNGNEKAVAKAFNTIRGQLGVLNLLANEGTNFSNVLEAIRDRSGRAATAAQEINKTKTNLINKEFQTLDATLRTVGDEINTLKLGALIFINDVIANLPAVAAAFQPVIDKVKELLALLNRLTNPTAEVATNRVAQIEAAADSARAQSALDQTTAQRSALVTREAIGGAGLDAETAANANEVNKAIFEAEKNQAKLNAQLEFTKAQLEANVAAQKEFARVSRNENAPGLIGGSSDEARQLRSEAESLTTTLSELSSRAVGANETQITLIKEELDLERRKLDAKIQSGAISEDDAKAQVGQVQAVEQQIAGLTKIAELQVQSAAQDVIAQEGKRVLNEVLDQTTQKLGTDLPEAANKGTTAIQKIPDPQVNAAPAIAQMNALTAAANRAAAAVARAGSGGGGSLYFGGSPVYRAAGGRGQDTIPAMLSRDEFVVNSRDARKNFAQLQAINAGQSPQFREQGGAVTNIGDINVNVTGGSGSENPDAVGRSIANSLRRELRRKTSAL